MNILPRMTKLREREFDLPRDSISRPILIAVDYGTTSSHITYVSKEQSKLDLEVMMDWPRPKVLVIGYDWNPRNLSVWGPRANPTSKGKLGADYKARQKIAPGKSSPAMILLMVHFAYLFAVMMAGSHIAVNRFTSELYHFPGVSDINVGNSDLQHRDLMIELPQFPKATVRRCFTQEYKQKTALVRRMGASSLCKVDITKVDIG